MIATEPEPQQNLHFLDYWRVIKARKEIILAVILLVVLTGTGVTFLLPKQYRAIAKIQVRQDNTGMQVFSQNRDSAYSPYFLATEYHVIKRRENLEKVATALNLPVEWGKRYNPDNSPLTLRQTVEILDGRVNLEQPRNTSVINIRVTHDVPEEARLIANKLAEAYQDYRLDLKADEIRRGLGAMEKVALQQESRVRAAEETVERIRRDHEITEIQEGLTVDKLTISKLQGDLSTAKQEMVKRETRLNELKDLPDEQLIQAYNYLLYDRALETVRQRLREAKESHAVVKGDLGDEHPKVVALREAIKTLEEQLADGVEGLRKSMEADYRVSQAGYETLKSELDAIKEAERNATGDRILPFVQAKREMQLQRDLYQAVKARTIRERFEGIMPRDPVQIFEYAEVPDHHVSPKLELNILLALLIGTVLGISLAFFLEYLDTSVKTVDDIERYLGLPVIGVIPQKMRMLNKEGPDSIGAEAYRLLRTNLQFSRSGEGAGVHTVTSAGAGEGKSTTVFNLAYICAHMGDRVLVVDADLRRPVQHKFFETSHRVGLADVLMRDVPVEETIKSTAFPQLDFLPSGKLARASIGLINVEKMRALIKLLRGKYDIVLFDAPPIMGVSDASILASEVDGVLQVIQYRKYPRAISARAKRLIENVGGTIIGVVLNRINILQDEYYSYFQSYYTHEPDEEPEAEPAPAPVSRNPY